MDGRRSGAAAVAGLVAGGVVHVVMGALGVGLLLRMRPAAFNTLLVAGALYVGWLGWQLWRHPSGLASIEATALRAGPPTRSCGPWSPACSTPRPTCSWWPCSRSSSRRDARWPRSRWCWARSSRPRSSGSTAWWRGARAACGRRCSARPPDRSSRAAASRPCCWERRPIRCCAAGPAERIAALQEHGGARRD
ncbi:LysE family transporter [Ramlibacter terrae]|uniref:LysE family transporter n=1 Tax=Ramlibacter terrae TaxID=2732511 RepID=A0ABX6P5U9_9BURK|nr:LysE family transporter [Ramlibacter terrae]